MSRCPSSNSIFHGDIVLTRYGTINLLNTLSIRTSCPFLYVLYQRHPLYVIPWGWLVEWGFYALSASKAIFRARTYNCNLFSPVMMITWWMKQGGNRPPGDNPLVCDLHMGHTYARWVKWSRKDAALLDATCVPSVTYINVADRISWSYHDKRQSSFGVN